MRASTKFLWVATGLLLAGCGRDTEVLDRFSRSYSSFLDAESDTIAASYVPVIRSEDNPNNPFWVHLRAALDPRGTNAARVQSASACIAAYDSAVSPYLDQFSEQVENLDKKVLELIETANAVHDREYRSDALDVAKSAREIQTNLAAISHLLVGSFGVQRKIMERLTADGGNLVAVISSHRQAFQDVTRMSKEIEERRRSLTSAEQKYGDAFSALKGKAGLKHYATKYDR